MNAKGTTGKSLNVKLPMCLLPWIDKSKLDWIYLSKNPCAIELLKQNIDFFN